MVRSKHELAQRLPVERDGMTIRILERADIDMLLAWPKYPPSFAMFQPTFAGNDQVGNNVWFERWATDEHRLPMVVDWESISCAGYLVLVDIAWESGSVGDLGVRLRPDLCDKGLGTRMMNLLCDWAFGSGLTSIRFDVAAPNGRAARCYEKAGFIKTGEFWKDDPYLNTIDLSAPENGHIVPHARFEGDVPQVRFYYMEQKAPWRGSF